LCPFNRKTAGHHDEDVRSRGQDLVPRHNPRGATRLCEDILTAGELDHLRNPMTCDVQWREPFDAGHAGALREALDASANGLESVTQVRGETMALRRPTSGVADSYDIVDYVMDCTRVQCEDGWLVREGAKGVVQLVRRDGTDMTEVLGQDQIGLRLPQQMVFQPIEPLS
jgi:hypothetical protein